MPPKRRLPQIESEVYFLNTDNNTLSNSPRRRDPPLPHSIHPHTILEDLPSGVASVRNYVPVPLSSTTSTPSESTAGEASLLHETSANDDTIAFGMDNDCDEDDNNNNTHPPDWMDPNYVHVPKRKRTMAMVRSQPT